MHSIVYIYITQVLHRFGQYDAVQTQFFFPYVESLLRIIYNLIGIFKVGMFFVHCETWNQLCMT